jgi:hypothetical protein
VEDSLSAHVEEYREGQSASGCQAADLALEPREDALHFRHIAASVLPPIDDGAIARVATGEMLAPDASKVRRCETTRM